MCVCVELKVGVFVCLFMSVCAYALCIYVSGACELCHESPPSFMCALAFVFSGEKL